MAGPTRSPMAAHRRPPDRGCTSGSKRRGCTYSERADRFWRRRQRGVELAPRGGGVCRGRDRAVRWPAFRRRAAGDAVWGRAILSLERAGAGCRCDGLSLSARRAPTPRSPRYACLMDRRRINGRCVPGLVMKLIERLPENYLVDVSPRKRRQSKLEEDSGFGRSFTQGARTMKKSKFTEEQIAYALRQVEGGSPARRRLPAAGRQRSHLLHLEEEVRAPGRQRAAAAALARGRECAAEAPGRATCRSTNTSSPRRCEKKSEAHTAPRAGRAGCRRTFARQLRAGLSLGAVQSGRVVSPSRRATIRRPCDRAFGSWPTRDRDSAITRIWVLLRREGWPVNKKRVRRLYRLDGLQLRMRVRRRKHIALAPRPRAGARRARPSAGAWTSSTMRWPMDGRFGC